MRLRDYFSEVMSSRQDLLSISYNPDARYAFINFRTEAARMLAIQQAAHRLFDARRLDCRIRRCGSDRSTKVNYGLSSGRPGQPISISPDNQPSSLYHKVEELSQFPEANSTQYGRDKFFVLKSYSLDTLYQSLSSGVWQVPKRHVERLNHAFQTARKVYLLFSVNGSRQFFGYASMRAEMHDSDEESPRQPSRSAADATRPTPNAVVDDESSPVSNEESQPNSRASRRQSLASCDSASSTSSISYDPQRRKITWHAPGVCPDVREHSLSSSLDPAFSKLSPWFPSTTPFSSPSSTASSELSLDANLTRYTRPCEIKWLSTQSVPFDEIRGLRNPWNGNKEIHVARNVTAVEPSAAAVLLRRWGEKEKFVRGGSNVSGAEVWKGERGRGYQET